MIYFHLVSLAPRKAVNHSAKKEPWRRSIRCTKGWKGINPSSCWPKGTSLSSHLSTLGVPLDRVPYNLITHLFRVGRGWSSIFNLLGPLGITFYHNWNKMQNILQHEHLRFSCATNLRQYLMFAQPTCFSENRCFINTWSLCLPFVFHLLVLLCETTLPQRPLICLLLFI